MLQAVDRKRENDIEKEELVRKCACKVSLLKKLCESHNGEVKLNESATLGLFWLLDEIATDLGAFDQSTNKAE